MAAEKEQVRPLAPAASRRVSTDDDQENALPRELNVNKNRRRRRYIKCCGCICATILILVVIIIVLAFTVFRVKDPTIRLNSITIDGWSNVVWTNLQPGMNLTVIADMSVKNPNAASFKFKNATTSLSYDQIVIGEVRTPEGNARARRTLRLNATIDAMLDKIIGVPRLANDLRLGKLPVSTFTRISGKVSVLKIVKKSVGVRASCTASLNINTQQIEDLSCDNKISL